MSEKITGRRLAVNNFTAEAKSPVAKFGCTAALVTVAVGVVSGATAIPSAVADNHTGTASVKVAASKDNQASAVTPTQKKENRAVTVDDETIDRGTVATVPRSAIISGDSIDSESFGASGSSYDLQEGDVDFSPLVAAAYKGIGSGYVFGGTQYGAWDCSGFAQWVYRQAGVEIPRTTYAQMAALKATSNPKPGDLVMQNDGEHVGIYVGNGMMISALNPSQGTLLHSVDAMPVAGYYTVS